MTPINGRKSRGCLGLCLAVSLALGSCVGDIEGTPGAGTGGGRPADSPGGQVPAPVPGCDRGIDVGHVVAHRLNRVEYNNTIRDLLGNSSSPADEFPADVPVGGFDNNAANLNLGPGLLAQYQGAAQRLAAAAASKAGFINCGSTAMDAACAKKILEPFVRRAWRRPVTSDEIAELVKLVDLARANNDTFANGMALAVEAVLTSPNFLFRFEIPPTPQTTGTYSLDAYAMASRLSYFLWSSMPDEPLLAAAEAKQLLEPEGLTAQVVRMLRDPKSGALAENLAGQWLGGRGVTSATPDVMLFPQFNPDLQASIETETQLFLQAFIQENLDLRSLLTADFTFLNETLANHYKIAGTGLKGPAFKRVSLAGNQQRGGILTQGSFLVSTSKPREPGIAVRGKWVLERLLCSEIPPPPADALAKQAAIEQTLGSNPTRRQAADARDRRPDCGGCHARFDPIGLALDKYDAIGAYRELDASKRSINTSGNLNGVSFSGGKGLFPLLRDDAGLPGCVTKALFKYALGRVTSAGDTCLLDDITSQALGNGFHAQDVIAGLVTGPAFRFQSE